MLLAVLFSRCILCQNLPVLGLLKALANEESGVIIMATLLLFPTAIMLYGGAHMIFAAKEAVERRAKKRLKKQREEGRAEGREQIRAELEKRGMLTPELADIFEKERKAQE